MLHVLEHSIIDSLKVFGLTLIIYIILSFFEEKLTNLFKKHKKISPVIGASVGLVPQCGFSVVAADLYIKEHITIGCLFAVFFACSDEALPLLFTDLDKAIYIIPLILFKLIFGFAIGFILDLVYKKKINQNELVVDDVHVGCCHHHIDHEESKIRVHLVHPLIHSLKILLYVFIVNFIFETIVHFVGEDNISTFLSQSKYFTPLVCGLVGLMPNCAPSILITELFVSDVIPFGALFTGLSVNAGLGLIYLLKNKKSWKDILVLMGTLIVSSIVIGYGIIGVMSLF